MMGGAAVAAALSVSPAHADSQVVVRGLSFPADSATKLSIVGCEGVYNRQPEPIATYLSRGGPAGTRSFKYDLAGGNAVGSQSSVALHGRDHDRRADGVRPQRQRRGRVRRLPGARRLVDEAVLGRPRRPDRGGERLAADRRDRPDLHVDAVRPRHPEAGRPGGRRGHGAGVPARPTAATAPGSTPPGSGATGSRSRSTRCAPAAPAPSRRTTSRGSPAPPTSAAPPPRSPRGRA